jgi:hypothetical protein
MLPTHSDSPTLPVPDSIQALGLQIERAFTHTQDKDNSKLDSGLSDREEEGATELFSKKKEPSNDILHQTVSQSHLQQCKHAILTPTAMFYVQEQRDPLRRAAHARLSRMLQTKVEVRILHLHKGPSGNRLYVNCMAVDKCNDIHFRMTAPIPIVIKEYIIDQFEADTHATGISSSKIGIAIFNIN